MQQRTVQFSDNYVTWKWWW